MSPGEYFGYVARMLSEGHLKPYERVPIALADNRFGHVLTIAHIEGSLVLGVLVDGEPEPRRVLIETVELLRTEGAAGALRQRYGGPS